MDAAPDDDTRESMTALLRWYLDMGVDWAVDDVPHDRFAESIAAAARPASPAPSPAPPQHAAPTAARAAPATKPPLAAQLPMAEPARPLNPDAAVQSAQQMAASANTLEELRAALEAFDGCALKRTASQLVFSDGNPQARIMLVGEAPGADEDRQGRPFVGPAGQLLDRMLAAIGLDRTSVYIANVAPWRPPGNRTPTPQETAICLPFTLRQIALVNPDILVTLGGASAQALLGVKEGVMRARGSWRRFNLGDPENGGRSLAAIATLHPAYLLRSAGAKRLAWRDLREIRKEYDKLEH